MLYQYLKKDGVDYIDLIYWASKGLVDDVRHFFETFKGKVSRDTLEKALIMASMNGHAPVVEILLKTNVDKSAYDCYALRVAKKMGYEDIAKLLE